MLQNRFIRLLIFMLIITSLFPGSILAYTISPDKQELSYEEWIVKWEYRPISSSENYEIIKQYNELKVTKIRIPTYIQEQAVNDLMEDPNVKYVEKNIKYKVNTTLNDTQLAEQYYLDQTGIKEAWQLVPINADITIAVLDTGVDLEHPDLKANLVKGINLIDEQKTVQDDNGHGTMIAGVTGAVGHNQEGISGVLWQSRIMPIKVMDKYGEGEAVDVARGIKVAVEQGADIILLSLGDPIYSELMRESVEFAESKNVIVVSATGNNGRQVNYPAALPTVIAVGSVDKQDQVPSYSNFGPEVDVVAPGDKILTTKLGGGYTTSSGTSLAAPQVAGLVGLLISKYPDYTPSQIRDLVRFTAKDVGAAGWDQRTGYGRIDAVKALTTPQKNDWFEPNNQIEQSRTLPIGKLVEASIVTNDVDWYKLEVPYNGSLQINMKKLPESIINKIKFTLYTDKMNPVKNSSPNGFEGRVKNGTYFLEIGIREGEMVSEEVLYSIVTNIMIDPDVYEPNDDSGAAQLIPTNVDSFKGNIHVDKDQDWFKFNIPYNGRFSFKLTTDSLRLDPLIYVIKPDENVIKVDNGSVNNDQVEEATFEVTPGTLYISVKNFYDYGINAEYSVTWDYEPLLVDKYEPNNTILSAKGIKLNESIYGTIGSITDYDWFKFVVAKDGFIQIDGSNIPLQVRAKMQLYDNKYKNIAAVSVSNKQTQFSYQKWLTKGTYFIRIDAYSTFTDQLYELKVSTLDSVFRDINNNWAKDSINRMAALGIINGYSDKTFKPNNPITRAEFVNLIVETLELPKGAKTAKSPFKDVASSYWAYPSILAAYNKGILTGYEDRTFRPNAPITRAEMATLLVKGLKIKPAKNSNTTNPNPQTAVYRFSDVHARYWATTSISFLVQLGLINGYEDRTFRPENNTSRAETTVLLERIWYSK